MNIAGFAHGIYTQNEVGTKRIEDNVIFNQFGKGLVVYGNRGQVVSYHIEGNTIFNNGSTSITGELQMNLLVGGHTPSERIRVVENYTYHRPGATVANVRLGYQARDNRDVTFKNNYVVGGQLEANWWENYDFTDNLLSTDAPHLLILALTPPFVPSDHVWDNNRYYYTGGQWPMGVDGSGFGTFAQWQAGTGFDRHSQYQTAPPAGASVFVRPNRHEAGRAHIIVYNWEGSDWVEADLSGALRVGERYEVRDAQDYVGGRALLSGSYDGRSLRLPMRGLSAARPVGYGTGAAHTGPRFNVFVLVPGT